MINRTIDTQAASPVPATLRELQDKALATKDRLTAILKPLKEAAWQLEDALHSIRTASGQSELLIGEHKLVEAQRFADDTLAALAVKKGLGEFPSQAEADAFAQAHGIRADHGNLTEASADRRTYEPQLD